MSRLNQMTKGAILLTLLCSFVLAMSGCSQGDERAGSLFSDGSDRLYVAVSIVPQASFVKAVGGDLVEVLTVIPPGASPEDYAPDPQTMEKLSKARVYFAIGVPTETNGILPRLEHINSQMKVVNLPQQVDRVYPAREMAPGKEDPHRWLSPKRAVIMVQSIASELAQADPFNAEIYQNNARVYQSELEALHEEITAALTGLSQRSFIVYHPAMGYFADDYGLTMIALEEEGKPATAKNIQRVIDQAKREGIKVVFYQAEMDGRQAKTLAREIGGEAELIAPLAADYIENLHRIGRLFSHALAQQ